jgi:hypothetical protein
LSCGLLMKPAQQDPAEEMPAAADGRTATARTRLLKLLRVV